MIADAKEALDKYGETLDIRRDSLQSLLQGGSEVPIQRVRLFYEGGDLRTTPSPGSTAWPSGTWAEE